MALEYLNLLERVFDEIADKLITSQYVNQNIVKDNQKTIRNGIIQTARDTSETLVLYQKDIKANEEDLIQIINTTNQETAVTSGLTLNQIVENIYLSNPNVQVGVPEGITITIFADGENNSAVVQMGAPAPYTASFNITPLIAFTNEDGTVNPLNISQFLGIEQKTSNISPEQANEFLDTNIYELLTGVSSRQERINAFFDEFQNLVNDFPNFVDENEDDLLDIATDYDASNDISQNPINANASITRLDRTVESVGDSINSGQTLESLRNTLNTYLQDIDDQSGEAKDERPIYENQSSGYLKFRNLNQGIIIRNANNDFVEGLNPETRDYLSTGFTITMWVRFLDKVSAGTLFNFANPTRNSNPFGFKLDTLISDERRYLRLLVLDNDGIGVGSTNGQARYYDSHVGNPSFPKIDLLGNPSNLTNIDPSQYTEVPLDFTEWYFICATYNPNINEVDSLGYDVRDADYWRNNMVHTGDDSPNQYTANSNYGNRSKVEIISKGDLLRARGFNVNTSTQS